MLVNISTQNAPAAIGPYSQGIVSGGLIFTSGQIPVDPGTGSIPPTVEEQAEQALINLRNVIEAGGGSLDKVVKTTVFIKNMDDFAKVNAIYAQFFSEPYPARSCIEASRLPKGVLIEIEAMAAL
jgi:2-iminobutanoate/2-iminopropanoate deaminase